MGWTQWALYALPLAMLLLIVLVGMKLERARDGATNAQVQAEWYRSRAAQLEERMQDWRRLAETREDRVRELTDTLAQMKREGFEVLPSQVDDESWRLTDEEEAQVEQARRNTASSTTMSAPIEASGWRPATDFSLPLRVTKGRVEEFVDARMERAPVAQANARGVTPEAASAAAQEIRELREAEARRMQADAAAMGQRAEAARHAATDPFLR